MALKYLRDNLRHLKFILWGVVVVFVLLVFVDWGSGRSGGGGGGSSAVKVGDRSVSETEFVTELRRMNDRFQQQFGDQWNQLRGQVDLAGQTVAFFVDRELQLAEADAAGIVISDDELREAILETPIFVNESGAFVGQQMYEKIVRSYFQMTPQDFEKRFAEDLRIARLAELVERGVHVTDAEVEAELRRQRESADVEAIQIRYERFLNDVTLTDDELLAQYQENSEVYQRPEQRVIRYLVVETSRLRRTLPVSDEELRAYYDDHTDDFVLGEQANARHILFRLAPSADAETRTAVRLRADGVLTIAQSGGDFAALATEHSEDPGSKDNGGDLGWFGRGEMVAEFEEAVFNAKPGEIIGPVTSQFGLHIIKVEGFKPERQQPFDEVVEQVRFRVLEGRAAAEAEIQAASLVRRLAADQPEDDDAWQAIADENEALVLNVSPPFERGQAVAGTGGDTALSDEIFDAAAGDIGGPRQIPRGWIVWQLSEIRPEGIPPFEDVRQAVEQEVRKLKALGLAVGAGTRLAEAWRAGGDASGLADEVGSTVIEAPQHRRTAGIGGVGPVPAVDRAVFAANAGDVVGPIGVGDRGVVVAKVNGLTLLDDAAMDREGDTVRARLTAERAQQLLRSMLNERRRDTVVVVDNDLMERFAPRG
jgi:peptidyl-prolyl cis-trans isomerase D